MATEWETSPYIFYTLSFKQNLAIHESQAYSQNLESKFAEAAVILTCGAGEPNFGAKHFRMTEHFHVQARQLTSQV